MEELYDLQIARIKEKLSKTHGIWLYPPTSLNQVESAERNYNVQLPPAYRRFLLEIGDGGWLSTWPLYPLAKALSMVEGHLSTEFPFTGDFSVDEQTADLLRDEHLEYDLNGALPVFYFGCTHSDILVMNGRYAGTVMYNGSGTDQGFIPYTKGSQNLRKSSEFIEASKRLDYLGWFENKLDNG